MALKVDVCEDADMYRFFEIYSETFGLGEEYINVVFPNHSSPEGRTIGGKRMLDIKKSDPNTTFLKVTDTATSEMIGLAKWNIYDGFIPPETGLDTTEFWDTSEEAAYADALHRSFLKDRRAAIKSAGGHILSKFEEVLKPRLAGSISSAAVSVLFTTTPVTIQIIGRLFPALQAAG